MSVISPSCRSRATTVVLSFSRWTSFSGLSSTMTIFDQVVLIDCQLDARIAHVLPFAGKTAGRVAAVLWPAICSVPPQIPPEATGSLGFT